MEKTYTIKKLAWSDPPPGGLSFVNTMVGNYQVGHADGNFYACIDWNRSGKPYVKYASREQAKAACEDEHVRRVETLLDEVLC